jgi:hypothetical protein
MAVISAANLKYYWSGGSADGVGVGSAAISLGSFRSATEVSGAINQIFDDISGDEAAAGHTEYRCIYFRNEDANAGGLISPVVWIDGQAADGETIAIGIDPAGKNATAATISPDTNPPAGVSFTSPITKATGLALPTGPYAQNDRVPIWIRRVTPGSQAASNSVSASIRVEGDSGA